MIFQTIVRIFKVLTWKGFLHRRMIINQVAKTVLAMFYLMNSSGSCVKIIRKTSTHLAEEQKQLRKTEKKGRSGCAENTQWKDKPAPTGSLAPDVHYFSLIVLFPNIFYFLVGISSVFITWRSLLCFHYKRWTSCSVIKQICFRSWWPVWSKRKTGDKHPWRMPVSYPLISQ